MGPPFFGQLETAHTFRPRVPHHVRCIHATGTSRQLLQEKAQAPQVAAFGSQMDGRQAMLRMAGMRRSNLNAASASIAFSTPIQAAGSAPNSAE
jgi:hypothetical protein